MKYSTPQKDLPASKQWRQGPRLLTASLYPVYGTTLDSRWKGTTKQRPRGGKRVGTGHTFLPRNGELRCVADTGLIMDNSEDQS